MSVRDVIRKYNILNDSKGETEIQELFVKKLQVF